MDVIDLAHKKPQFLRRLFTIASAISLVLFLAIVILWVRSFYVGRVIGNNTFEPSGNRVLWIQTWWYIASGSVRLQRLIYSEPPSAPARLAKQFPSTNYASLPGPYTGQMPPMILGIGYQGGPPRSVSGSF